MRRASRAPPSRKIVSRKSKTTTERGRLYAYGFASVNTATSIPLATAAARTTGHRSGSWK